MKVLLIVPPRRRNPFIYPLTSLLYIAEAIRSAGHEAEIVDIPYLLEKQPDSYSLLDNSLYKHILDKDCDLLGIGGMVNSYFFYDDFIEKFKESKKNIPVIVGGHVGFANMDIWEKHNPVDYIVNGNGEIVIQQFIKSMAKNDQDAIKKIPGLSYIENGKYRSNPPELIQDIDQIPFLNYDDYDYEYYIDELSKWMAKLELGEISLNRSALRVLPFFTSRGCPYKCTFCYHSNNIYQSHSVDYVLENIKYLKEKYSINMLYWGDDLLVFNRKRSAKLFEAIYKANLGIYHIGGGGKPSLLTVDLLKSMKKAGFVRLSFGIESGSQKMLDNYKKKVTVGHNFDALKNTKEAGIPAMANVFFGGPGENHETLKATKEFLIESDLKTGRFFCAWATALPGTSLYELGKKKGLINDSREYLFSLTNIGELLINFSELPRDKLEKEVLQLMNEVDIAYFMRHREFKPLLITLARWVAVNLLFLFRADTREKIKGYLRPIRECLQPSRGSIKNSEVEIEKWFANAYDQKRVPNSEKRF